MIRAILALALLVIVTAALQLGGALTANGPPAPACGVCHN